MDQTNPHTITKKALIDRIADQTGQKRTVVRETIQEFLDQIVAELADGNRLEFRDFGVFEIRERAPRMAQNPRTLERVPVPARRSVKFKAGRRMRDQIEPVVEPVLAPQIRITQAAAEHVATETLNHPVKAASG